jgi:hypothetical protein
MANERTNLYASPAPREGKCLGWLGVPSTSLRDASELTPTAGNDARVPNFIDTVAILFPSRRPYRVLQWDVVRAETYTPPAPQSPLKDPWFTRNSRKFAEPSEAAMQEPTRVSW